MSEPSRSTSRHDEPEASRREVSHALEIMEAEHQLSKPDPRYRKSSTQHSALVGSGRTSNIDHYSTWAKTAANKTSATADSGAKPEPSPRNSSDESVGSPDCEGCTKLRLENARLLKVNERHSREYRELVDKFNALATGAEQTNTLHLTQINALEVYGSEMRAAVDDRDAYMLYMEAGHGELIGDLLEEMATVKDLNLSRQMTNADLHRQIQKLKDDFQGLQWKNAVEKDVARRRYEKLQKDSKEELKTLQQEITGLQYIMTEIWYRLSPEEQAVMQPLIDRFEAGEVIVPPNTEDSGRAGIAEAAEQAKRGGEDKNDECLGSAGIAQSEAGHGIATEEMRVAESATPAEGQSYLPESWRGGICKL